MRPGIGGVNTQAEAINYGYAEKRQHCKIMGNIMIFLHYEVSFINHNF